MKPRVLRFISGFLFAASYVLVFYAGLAIGVSSSEAEISPIIALVFAIFLGAAASATREIVPLYENNND